MNIGKIKDTVIRVIGFSNYRKILTTAMRSVTKVKDHIMCGEFVVDAQEYGVTGKDSFFGYYDLQSLSDDGSKLLSNVIDGHIAEVGYFEVETKEFKKIADTHAWNWQMGARMRWFENGKSILFNDFDGKEFIARVVDLDGNELKKFPYPIFDVDIASGIAYFCDFTILHHLREGYGYPNKRVNFEDYYKTAENGLYMFRLGDDSARPILTIESLRTIEPTDDMAGKYHYINHITINPENGDVMFFHLWTDGKGSWKNRMIFVNRDGKLIRIISDFDRASHYTWKGKDHILVSVYLGGKAEYRLYDYRTGNGELVNGIKTDGHPTFINNRFFITDTYANRCAMQSIYLCDIKEHTYRNFFSIYHNTEKVGAERCDLHPRVKGNLLNIDSVAGTHRCQYLIKTNYCTKGTSQWDRQLLLDKQAYIEDPGPVSASLIACIDSEYKANTGRPISNKLKIMMMYLENPGFKANVYINRLRMLSGKKKEKLRKKIYKKYGVVIDAASIGIHFRADHVVGIVIGPGAVIGDHCRMYQNVTIGQKDGKFPRIGNHVTIFPGAVIIGDIKIGDYAVIGANAVVTNDVPEGATAVGIPARNIIGR